MAISLEEVRVYLEVPAQERPAVVFDAKNLKADPSLDAAQTERLRSIVRLQGKPDQRAAERLLIDLSWASSHLEGNSYSQLDTQTLLEWGKKNPGKPIEDAVMILNHKDAIRILLENSDKPLSIDLIKQIHTALANAHETTNSRHFLPPEQLGALREYGDLIITGSSYFPASNLGPMMHKHMEGVVKAAITLDPINAAFHIMTRLPYLQPFMDANKRTSRIAANLPLMNAGLAPFSFVGMQRDEYLKGVIAFYELGHEEILKSAFIRAYGFSALSQQPMSTENRVALVNNRVEAAQQIADFVLSGAAPTSSFLKPFLQKMGRPDPVRGAQAEEPPCIP